MTTNLTKEYRDCINFIHDVMKGKQLIMSERTRFEHLARKFILPMLRDYLEESMTTVADDVVEYITGSEEESSESEAEFTGSEEEEEESSESDPADVVV